TQGQSDDSSLLKGGDGVGITERTKAARLASGEIRVKTTFDRYETAPSGGQYDGDSYLVGRLVPLADGRFDTEFVGFNKIYDLYCKDGFDESVPDLWAPDGLGPRFCLGRPLGARRFATITQFRDTAQDLQAIGLVSKTELVPVAFDPAVNCGN